MPVIVSRTPGGVMSRSSFLSLLALFVTLGNADAAETIIGPTGAIVITKASIESGVLRVEGTTTKGTTASLDGIYSTPVGTRNRKFAFSVVYVPQACIVTVSAGGNSLDAVVANCGTQGLYARGNWSSATTYGEDDIVVYQGSAWRGLANAAANLNQPPATSPDFWELLVSKGDTGSPGPAGAAGSKGDTGPAGPAGAPGPTGAKGEAGPAGAKGDTGPAGSSGSAGAAGPQGPAGADGATGPQGAPGPTGATGAPGATGPRGPGVANVYPLPTSCPGGQYLVMAYDTSGDPVGICITP